MKKALVWGLNHFAIPGNDLSGCVPDAIQMAGVFSALDCSVQKLLDKQATASAIESYLLALQAEAKSTKGFYYVGLWGSGHGSHYPSVKEGDGLGELIVCYDIKSDGDNWVSGFIKDRRMREILNGFPANGVVEIGLDICYSGGMDRGMIVVDHEMTAFYKSRFLHNPNNPTGHLRVANSTISHGLNSNIIMWCASSEPQESADAWIAGGAHGAFTYYWCEAFKKNPKASRVELLIATRKALTVNGYDQVPRLKCWNAAAQRSVGK